MKPRHAAALALVGWYLMVPQIQSEKQNLIGPFTESHEPDFPNWHQVGSYDTAAECEAARAQLPATLIYDHPVAKDTLAVVAKFAQCIAPDDPRLKGN